MKHQFVIKSETRVLKLENKPITKSESERVESWTRNVDFALRQDPRPIAQTTGTMDTRRINTEDWNTFDKAKVFLDEQRNNTKPFLLYWGIRR